MLICRIAEGVNGQIKVRNSCCSRTVAIAEVVIGEFYCLNFFRLRFSGPVFNDNNPCQYTVKHDVGLFLNNCQCMKCLERLPYQIQQHCQQLENGLDARDTGAAVRGSKKLEGNGNL